MTKQKAGSRKAAKAKKDADPSPDKEEDATFDALMSEVEADLRDEQMQQFWTKHRNSIFAAMGAIVLVVAAYQGWQGMLQERRAAQAESFAEATAYLIEDNTADALVELQSVADEGGAYGALADLQRAGILIEQGQREDALAIYQRLSADPAVDYVFSDMASLLWGLHGLDSEDPTTLEQVLAPLTDPSNAHSYTALELTALLAVRQGNTAQAASIFDQLINDANTPVGIRNRATEMAAVFSSQSATP